MTQQHDQKTQEGLQDVFNTMSQNGRLGGADLLAAIRAAGPPLTDDNIKQVAPADGSVDYAGFVQIMGRLAASEGNQHEELVEAFRVFDKRGKGLIPAPELRHILTSLGEKMSNSDVDEMFREASLANDGELNYEEFARMMFSQQ
ncbi:hypothetical protein LPJ70_003799 [Coemansia sp. RSA 2708]|nr:hypothetical protein LPJ70_003799 [Coemansia sp. RSA 2708]